jgi:hypothetical protein
MPCGGAFTGVSQLTVTRANGRPLRSLDARDDVRVAFSADSRELALTAVADSRPVVLLQDVHSGVVRHVLKAGRGGQTILALACSADGRVAAADGATVYLWERASGQRLKTGGLPRGFEARQIVITDSGRVLVVGTQAGVGLQRTAVVVYDADRPAVVLTTPAVHRGAGLALCGRGQTLAVCDGDARYIVLFDVPPGSPIKRAALNGEALARLWEDLVHTDARRAWLARERFVSAPEEAVSFLARRLTPAAALAIPELADLDDDDFTIRRAAADRLAQALKRGDRAVELALRGVIDTPRSLEAFRTAERLLAGAKPVPFTPDELRTIRAVGVLERIGSDDARALLKRLASCGPSLIRDRAGDALQRLEQQ